MKKYLFIPFLFSFSAKANDLIQKGRDIKTCEAKMLWAQNEETLRAKNHAALLAHNQKYLPLLSHNLGNLQKIALQEPLTLLGAKQGPEKSLQGLSALKGLSAQSQNMVQKITKDLRASAQRKEELDDILQNRTTMRAELIQTVAALKKQAEKDGFQKEHYTLVLESFQKAKDIKTLISDVLHTANHYQSIRGKNLELTQESWSLPLEGVSEKSGKTLYQSGLNQGLVTAPCAARVLASGNYQGKTLIILEASDHHIIVLSNSVAFDGVLNGAIVKKGEPLGTLSEKQPHKLKIDVYKSGHALDFFSRFDSMVV